MFCHNCGEGIEKHESFCHNCGAPQLTAHVEYDSGKPLLTIKPRFVSSLTLISLIPVQLLFTAWAAIVFGISGFFIIKYMELNLHPWFFAVLFGCIFFIFTPIFILFSKMNRYNKTEYRFYNNKLDYAIGIFSIEEKSLNYDKIVEINLHRGAFQRICGIGTIVLSTPATGDINIISKSGIRLTDIENPDIVYRKIKYIIEKSKE
jgi:uncharacterized membrane protein YdbT with pleckstrin-like domain